MRRVRAPSHHYSPACTLIQGSHLRPQLLHLPYPTMIWVMRSHCRLMVHVMARLAMHDPTSCNFGPLMPQAVLLVVVASSLCLSQTVTKITRARISIHAHDFSILMLRYTLSMVTCIS